MSDEVLLSCSIAVEFTSAQGHILLVSTTEQLGSFRICFSNATIMGILTTETSPYLCENWEIDEIFQQQNLL
jgi:hypothetical protein